jgi:hypothetical protein
MCMRYSIFPVLLRLESFYPVLHFVIEMEVSLCSYLLCSALALMLDLAGNDCLKPMLHLSIYDEEKN